jgi:hypothetical protein
VRKIDFVFSIGGFYSGSSIARNKVFTIFNGAQKSQLTLCVFKRGAFGEYAVFLCRSRSLIACLIYPITCFLGHFTHTKRHFLYYIRSIISCVFFLNETSGICDVQCGCNIHILDLPLRSALCLRSENPSVGFTPLVGFMPLVGRFSKGIGIILLLRIPFFSSFVFSMDLINGLFFQ